MNRVRSEAPGKLLLFGEYAVLTGASAVVMAVDRRVRVCLMPAQQARGRLSAPQMGLADAAMQYAERRVFCEGVDLGMTGRLLPQLASRVGLDIETVLNADIQIDSGALFERDDNGVPIKLGLGSSGAVTAALALAFEHLASVPRASVVDQIRRWLPVYREALRSDASGADLAASFGGGLLVYRPDREQPLLTALEWPSGLCLQPVWIGTSAQTEHYVKALSNFRQRQPAAADALLSGMSAIVESLLADRSPQSWLRAGEQYAEALVELGRAMRRPIMTQPHQRLRDLAAACGVVYKSCGAGGGDLGLALGTDSDRLDAFSAACPTIGAHPLKLQIDPRGASILS